MNPFLAEFPGLTQLEELARFEGGRFTPFDVPARLLALLGDPQDQIPTVHVAGTNGKGSVCALVASMLRASGSSVGHFASPHLSHVNERCLINGKPIALADFEAAVMEVLQLAKREDVLLSYFVVGALASFLLFRAHPVDWNIIEVGLGGAFDATNAIRRPRATAITSIAFDHTHLLGSTLEEIAWNKAGITKEEVPMFVGAVPAQAEEVIRRQAHALRAPIEVMGVEFHYDVATATLECSQGRRRFHMENPLVQAPYQIANAALAARIAVALGLSDAAIAEGIRRARWPGRVETLIVEKKRFLPAGAAGLTADVLIDAAHNPEGVKALLQHLRNLVDGHRYKKLLLVFSILERKNWQDMLEAIGSFMHWCSSQEAECRIIGTKMSHHHALEPEAFHSILPQAKVIDDVDEALRTAVAEGGEGTLVVVSGSIYFLGQVRPKLTDDPFCTIAD